jgi:hypothetical protein
VSYALDLRLFIYISRLFFIKEGVGTIATGHRPSFVCRFTKGIRLPLGVFSCTFQTANLTTIDPLVNTRSACMLAGLFFFYSITGGHDE